MPLFQHEEAVFLDDTEKLVGAKKNQSSNLRNNICKNLKRKTRMSDFTMKKCSYINPSKMGIELRKHRGD